MTSVVGSVLRWPQIVPASHSTLSFSMFLLCVGLGMGQGFQPVAAFNYRAKKFDRVKKGLVFLIVYALILVGGFSAVTMLFPEQVIAIFQKKAEVIEIGSVALRYYAFGMIFMAFSVPVNMLYQSIQKPTISSFLSLIRAGMITIPLLLLLVPAIGLTGIQIAQPIADVIAGIISIPFIIHFLKSENS